MLIGGLVLLGPSLLFEPGALSSVTACWGWPAAAGWLFLVVFSSLVGYSLYMQLLRDIGSAKAGSFAFVSPAIAVLVGVAVGGEAISASSLAGMAVMLLAAGACLCGDALEARLVRARRAVSRSQEETASGRCRRSRDAACGAGGSKG